jgi:hypothetical protein
LRVLLISDLYGVSPVRALAPKYASNRQPPPSHLISNN